MTRTLALSYLCSVAGIYLHIPFCKKQCSYCDFHFSTTYESYQERMVEALKKELGMRAPDWQTERIETIYFGGGTPSLLSSEQIKDLISMCRELYSVSADPEITLECNPDDCSTEHLQEWKAAGVNRLSIGIQSLNNEQLTWMNRTHNAPEGTAAIHKAIEVGFDNLTVDLMYGLPDLSINEWKNQLSAIASLPVQHISAYCLTVEERTPLAAWVKTGKIQPSGNSDQSEQFLTLVEELNQHGFEQYEISNFARKQAYSKHNTNYWMGVHYIGIGPSAHGFSGNTRYWNIANNSQYMKQIELDTLPETKEELSLRDQFNELIMIGLRTKWGVEKVKLYALCAVPNEWEMQKDRFIAEGLMMETNTQLILTVEGRLRADAIASDLFLTED